MSIIPPFTTAIIFDIGNVIIDIDYEAVATAFRQIAVVDFSPIVSYKKQADFFDQFEKGEITAAAFRTAECQCANEQPDGLLDSSKSIS